MSSVVNPDGSVTRIKDANDTTQAITVGSIIKGVFIGMWLFYISAAIVSALVYTLLK